MHMRSIIPFSGDICENATSWQPPASDYTFFPVEPLTFLLQPGVIWRFQTFPFSCEPSAGSQKSQLDPCSP